MSNVGGDEAWRFSVCYSIILDCATNIQVWSPTMPHASIAVRLLSSVIPKWKGEAGPPREIEEVGRDGFSLALRLPLSPQVVHRITANVHSLSPTRSLVTALKSSNSHFLWKVLALSSVRRIRFSALIRPDQSQTRAEGQTTIASFSFSL